MSENVDEEWRRRGDRAAHIAAGLSAGAVLLLGGSGPLHQLGVLTLGSAYVGVWLAVGLGCVSAVVGAYATRAAISQPLRPPFALACVALALSSLAIAGPVRDWRRVHAAAPLHDVSTDLQRPPTFKTLSDVEPAASRPMPRPTRVDALQVAAYPDIKPILLPVPTDMAFEEVLETMADLDWVVADASEEDGIVETTVHSAWFGFKDDIVVRLTAIEGQTRVDVRAVARDGSNDGGRNAEHVREFLAELQR